MKTPISAKISRCRRSLGLTQERLGIILGVSPQAVSKWENDECLPDLLLIPRLCEALHITADSLLETSPAIHDGPGTAKVCASELFVHAPVGLSLSISGEAAVQSILNAGPAPLRELLSLLEDKDVLCVFRALSFTAVRSEAELARLCGLSPEAAQNALFRLLRAELCQRAPEGYIPGSGSYIAYAALATAYLAGSEGQAEISTITVSVTT